MKSNTFPRLNSLLALARKYREVLALLFLVGFTAANFFAHRKPSVEQNAVERAVIATGAPIERGINWVVFKAIDAYQGYVALRGVREENLTLRRDLLGARDALVAQNELSKENERLRQLLDFAQAQPLRTKPAPVVGDSLAPGGLSRTVRIGVGQQDGVRKGMAVLAAGGALGRVQQAHAHFSDVQLLVDPTSAVAARVERSRARATVAGIGRDRRCRLEFALRSDDIEEGDSLVTSGTDGVFPPGVPLGKVVDVQRKSSGMFLRAQVIPSVDPRNLEDVLVVLGERNWSGDEALPAAER
jgi:rod shape-determining protein MreC